MRGVERERPERRLRFEQRSDRDDLRCFGPLQAGVVTPKICDLDRVRRRQAERTDDRGAVPEARMQSIHFVTAVPGGPREGDARFVRRAGLVLFRHDQAILQRMETWTVSKGRRQFATQADDPEFGRSFVWCRRTDPRGLAIGNPSTSGCASYMKGQVRFSALGGPHVALGPIMTTDRGWCATIVSRSGKHVGQGLKDKKKP